MENINYTPGDLNSHHAPAAVIKNIKGEILMQDHVKYGFWTIIIGKAESRQDIKDALKQEVFEECNLTVLEFKELTSREYDYIRDGKPVKVHVHLFEITKYSGELANKEPNKHRSQIFMSLEKIKKLPYLSDSTLLYLEILGFKRNVRL